MSEYQKLMEKSEAASQKAIEFAKKGDSKMAAFWKNAAEGYKQKALNLPVGE